VAALRQSGYFAMQCQQFRDGFWPPPAESALCHHSEVTYYTFRNSKPASRAFEAIGKMAHMGRQAVAQRHGARTPRLTLCPYLDSYCVWRIADAVSVRLWFAALSWATVL
jgi:hypothetical protein